MLVGAYTGVIREGLVRRGRSPQESLERFNARG